MSSMMLLLCSNLRADPGLKDQQPKRVQRDLI
jgi:hypothetical protein